MIYYTEGTEELSNTKIFNHHKKIQIVVNIFSWIDFSVIFKITLGGSLMTPKWIFTSFQMIDDLMMSAIVLCFYTTYREWTKILPALFGKSEESTKFRTWELIIELMSVE